MENEINKPEYSPEERAKLIGTKRRHFAAVKDGQCEAEFDNFRPCDNCTFLGPECHKTCGIIMKHVARMPSA